MHASATAFALAAALLLSSSAHAQRVAVLDLDGDKKDQLRQQVEKAVEAGGELKRVSLKEYQSAAAGKGLKGAKAASPAGVAQVARGLKLSAVLTGTVGGSGFAATILDPAGEPRWTRELPLKGGRLSDDHARKLAQQVKNVAAAVAAEGPPAAADVPAAQANGGGESEGMGLDLSGNEPEPLIPNAGARSPVSSREDSPPESAGRRSDERTPPVKVGPKLFKVLLGGSGTWRTYCARPGVATCAAYDALPEAERPAGVTISFSPLVPYAGGTVGVELFPLARLLEGPLAGLGVTGQYGLGVSLLKVRSESAVDAAEAQDVTALDHAFQAYGTWRWHFGLGGEPGAPNVGYVGIFGGLQGRLFEVDLAANSPLPGSHRVYGAAGAELSIPLARFLKVEAAGSYFFGANPGVDELAAFGEAALGNGFSAEGGLAGDLVGPLGYTARFRYTRFWDLYEGKGQKWDTGGAAEESYATVFGGLTLAF